jgi:hypothetical protein
MKPSLSGADARVVRTEHHLKDFKFHESQIPMPNAVWRQTVHGLVATSQHETPTIIGVLVGEIVYNLRAALDYLIYELAFLDSGSIQDGTQFPIEDHEKGWLSRLKGKMIKGRYVPGWVEHLSVEHQAAIKTLQPYFGCQWTKRLREISNPDKHKRLSITRTHPVKQTIVTRRIDSSMDVETGMIPKVTFDDGAFVLETLQVLQQRVAEVIDSFKPEFQL